MQSSSFIFNQMQHQKSAEKLFIPICSSASTLRHMTFQVYPTHNAQTGCWGSNLKKRYAMRNTTTIKLHECLSLSRSPLHLAKAHITSLTAVYMFECKMWGENSSATTAAVVIACRQLFVYVQVMSAP